MAFRWVCPGCSHSNAVGLLRCACGQVVPQAAPEPVAVRAPRPARRRKAA